MKLLSLIVPLEDTFKDHKLRSRADLFSRDQKDFMASLLDALLGASDADVGAGVVGTWNSDLGGGLQLQLLQLLAVLANDEAMVLLGDGDRS